MTDPESPQWEDCKICGSPDHWTNAHPTTGHTEWCAVWGGACDCQRHPPSADTDALRAARDECQT